MSSQVTSNEGKLMTPPKLSLVTDTGAQVDCLSRHKLKTVGAYMRGLYLNYSYQLDVLMKLLPTS